MNSRLATELARLRVGSFPDKRIDEMTEEDIGFRLMLLAVALSDDFIDLERKEYIIPAIEDDKYFSEVISDKGQNNTLTLIRVLKGVNKYELDMHLEFITIEPDEMYQTAKFEVYLVKNETIKETLISGSASNEAAWDDKIKNRTLSDVMKV